jgi:dolichol-phosphate mannosyltransferase
VTPDRSLPWSYDSPRYSVVVPVYNEAGNVAEFCRKARAELPGPYELLICYDFDEDNTVPALLALKPEDKPDAVRLVRNRLGRGLRYAVEAGMKAAQAPIILVMMIDLADDFAVVGDMIGRIEAGADVVCASRYMPGGTQVGGPWLKNVLSRLAGLSLHLLAGLPTRDATNSFKAYRRTLIDRITIESTAGFCLALELTVKAHRLGARIEEIPASWHDRAVGKSRFKLLAWLPAYLRWYFWAIWRRIA